MFDKQQFTNVQLDLLSSVSSAGYLVDISTKKLNDFVKVLHPNRNGQFCKTKGLIVFFQILGVE